MARAIWTGAINFGLVNVPVKVYPAQRDHKVHFHQLEKATGARVRNEKVSDKSGEALQADDIELAYDLGQGKHVAVGRDELATLRPETTSTIDISDFVDMADIDPVYFDHTYWLVPAGQGAERAYRLLAAAADKTGRAGIGTVVMRNKQYLAAIRPLEGALAMSTMRFADEVVKPSDIDGLKPSKAKLDAKELGLASQIIDSLAGDWDPKRYHDTYTEELRQLLDRKAKGEVVESAAPDDRPAKVLDLMEALQASLSTARRPAASKPAKGTGKTEAKKEAKKTTAKAASRRTRQSA